MDSSNFYGVMIAVVVAMLWSLILNHFSMSEMFRSLDDVQVLFYRLNERLDKIEEELRNRN